MTKLKTENPRPPLAFSVNVTAQLLGVSRDTVLRMLKRGDLERRKAGSRVLIPHASVERFLEGRK